MTRLTLCAALALALTACADSTPPAEPVAGETTPATPAAQVEETTPATPADQDTGMDASAAIEAAVAGDWRDADYRERDEFRRPAQTLAFFGVEPSHTLVEITPGGGWYTEILAPLVRDDGRYVAAVVDPERASSDSQRDYATRQNDQLREKLAAHPDVYGPATVMPYDPADPVFGDPGSADAVVTFRNVHNWRMGGSAEAMFSGFFDVLAPGGVLGVVEHRAEGEVDAEDRSGYVGQDQVVALAEAAGFVLEEASEINANPADTRDHPNGVWTLPPSNRHDDADAERYAGIGESDRMTLRFRKPQQ